MSAPAVGQQITELMIPEELRANKPAPRPVKAREPDYSDWREDGFTKKQMVYNDPNMIKVERQERKVAPATHIIEPFVPIIKDGPRQQSKAEWLQGLGKGSVVALRGWSLGPFEAIGLVAGVTKTLVILTNGKRFDRESSMSAEHKQMITPVTEKCLKTLTAIWRRKLGI